MHHLYCPNCGKRIRIEPVGNFTPRWSSQKCTNCKTELSIHYEAEATFVKYSKKKKAADKKVCAIAP